MNDGQYWNQAYPPIARRDVIGNMLSSLFPLYQTIVDFYDDAPTPILGDNVKSYATMVIATPNVAGHGLIGGVFGI
jgi:hypothetical protein